MNKSILYYLLIFFAAGLHACSGSDSDNSAGEPNILHKPPFAAVTDSIRDSPKNAALYLRRAGLLAQTNNYDLASLDYKKSWELQPLEQTGQEWVACLAVLGRHDDKIKLLQDCIVKFPGSKDFPRLLGETWAESGKTSQALALYNQLLQKDSLDFETWYEKGLLLEELKDTAHAVQALQHAVALQPVNTYALELAHLYAESNNPLALSICDAIMANDVQKALPDPFFIKGIYFSNIRKYDAAVIQFDSCIKRDWKFTDAYIEKGIAFFKQKNYDEALNTFRLGATVSNTSPDAYYWIGRCYEAIKKKEDAMLNYERAVALDKNFSEAREALKRVRSAN
jgi:tetratricopeptide (TPR) repeat protein